MIGALLIAAAPAAPAGAATDVADLAVEASPGQVSGNTLTFRMIFHNYGPATVPTGRSSYEITAPGGTVFTHALERTLPNARCTVITAHRRLRCNSPVMIYPDDDQPSGVDGGLETLLDFTIVGRCISPGRYEVGYPGDPKRSNNSVTLRVAASTGKACTNPTQPPKKRTTRPAAAATPAAATPTTPSRTPTSVAATTTPNVPPAGTQAEPSTPDIAVERRSQAMPIALGGTVIAVLAVVALGAGLMIRRRRRT